MEPDAVTFGTLIDGFCKNGDLDRAYKLLREMEEIHKVSSSTATYNIIIRAYTEKLNVAMAEKLFREMVGRCLVPDGYTYRVMVDGYCKTGNVDLGYRFLMRMMEDGFVPSLTTLGRVINCLCVEDRVYEAAGIIHRMVQKGVVPEAVNTIFDIDKREVAAPKLVLEDLLKKGCITYYAYELLFDGLRDKRLRKKKGFTVVAI